MVYTAAFTVFLASATLLIYLSVLCQPSCHIFALILRPPSNIAVETDIVRTLDYKILTLNVLECISFSITSAIGYFRDKQLPFCPAWFWYT